MKPTPTQEARAAQTIADKATPIEAFIAEQTAASRGYTCELQDMERLNEQVIRVYTFMRDLRVHTLRQISASTGDPEASISARLREIRRYLRKGDKGDIIRKRVLNGNGLHTYELRLYRYPGAA